MLKLIKAKYSSKCNETGASIRAGENCYYNASTRKIYCDNSKAAEHYRLNAFNSCFNMGDANY